MRTALNVVLPDAPESLWHGPPRLHDLAYAYLKNLLLGGGLDPGDQISSEGVGRALSISRAPVSDAIRRLNVEGLLEILPHVGGRAVRSGMRIAKHSGRFVLLWHLLLVSHPIPMRGSWNYGDATVAATRCCTASPGSRLAPTAARNIGTGEAASCFGPSA